MNDQPHPQECEACKGSGLLNDAQQAWDIPEAPIPECHYCGGSGKTKPHPQEPMPAENECRSCGSKAWIVDGSDYYCDDCGEQYFFVTEEAVKLWSDLFGNATMDTSRDEIETIDRHIQAAIKREGKEKLVCRSIAKRRGSDLRRLSNSASDLKTAISLAAGMAPIEMMEALPAPPSLINALDHVTQEKQSDE